MYENGSFFVQLDTYPTPLTQEMLWVQCCNDMLT